MARGVSELLQVIVRLAQSLIRELQLRSIFHLLLNVRTAAEPADDPPCSVSHRYAPAEKPPVPSIAGPAQPDLCLEYISSLEGVIPLLQVVITILRVNKIAPGLVRKIFPGFISRLPSCVGNPYVVHILD